MFIFRNISTCGFSKFHFSKHAKHYKQPISIALLRMPKANDPAIKFIRDALEKGVITTETKASELRQLFPSLNQIYPRKKIFSNYWDKIRKKEECKMTRRPKWVDGTMSLQCIGEAVDHSLLMQSYGWRADNDAEMTNISIFLPSGGIEGFPTFGTDNGSFFMVVRKPTLLFAKDAMVTLRKRNRPDADFVLWQRQQRSVIERSKCKIIDTTPSSQVIYYVVTLPYGCEWSRKDGRDKDFEFHYETPGDKSSRLILSLCLQQRSNPMSAAVEGVSVAPSVAFLPPVDPLLGLRTLVESADNHIKRAQALSLMDTDDMAIRNMMALVQGHVNNAKAHIEKFHATDPPGNRAEFNDATSALISHLKLSINDVNGLCDRLLRKRRLPDEPERTRRLTYADEHEMTLARRQPNQNPANPEHPSEEPGLVDVDVPPIVELQQNSGGGSNSTDARRLDSGGGSNSTDPRQDSAEGHAGGASRSLWNLLSP